MAETPESCLIKKLCWACVGVKYRVNNEARLLWYTDVPLVIPLCVRCCEQWKKVASDECEMAPKRIVAMGGE